MSLIPRLRFPTATPTNHIAYFADAVKAHIPLGGDVLDVGAGGAIHHELKKLRGYFGTIAGIDPSPDVLSNGDLDIRIHGPIESTPLGEGRFDGAYASYVAEHIVHPPTFFSAVARALKPGAWFWVITPNALHPFAVLSRAIEVIGLKSLFREMLKDEKGQANVNDYPAYYRANNPYDLDHYRAFGYDAVSCLLIRTGWEGYFPRPLRWVPRMLDRVLAGTSAGMGTLMYGLRRSATGPSSDRILSSPAPSSSRP